MKAFLSPVPLNAGHIVESRRHDSPLGAVPIHCCSVTFLKQDVLLGELHREGNASNCDTVTVHTVVEIVDDQPTLT